ncbi:hypothetical protein BJX76DRAFT_358757 [Aspergillus varians]
MATCTSPETLCTKCRPLFDRILEHRQRDGHPPPRRHFLYEPNTYPVIFYTRIRVRGSIQDAIHRIERSDFHEAFRPPTKIWRATKTEPSGVVTLSYMVDFVYKVRINAETMSQLFSGTVVPRENWRFRIPREGECLNYLRMAFFIKYLPQVVVMKGPIRRD